MISDELKAKKSHSAHRLEEMRSAFDQEIYQLRERSNQRSLKQRLKEALECVGEVELWNSINSCQNLRRCGSLWCNHCRNQAANASERKVLKHVQNFNIQNRSLLHLTAPVGISEFDVEELQNIIHLDGLRWKRIRRKASFWIEAVYEFELVNMQFLRRSTSSDIKKKQMQEMVEHFRITSNEVLFVHWHGLTDLASSDITNTFGTEYFFSGSRLTKSSESGLYVQNLHQEKTVIENIKKLSSYPLKNPYRFKHSFKGSDYSNGEYFTHTELGRLVALYQKIQGRQWRTLRRHNQ